jgi:radical SAM protein with 4Fe4S-binding SPASM domain
MSFCSDVPPIDQAFQKEMFNKIISLRVPVAGSLELTQKCNLHCVHCYQQKCRIDDQGKKEIETEFVFKLIDEFIPAGTLYLTLTGGDPMLRDDFPDIYMYAVKKGLLVSVLCNGTLISQKIIDVFRKYPPRQVEITLHGADESSYESVTHSKGSYLSCRNGIDLLKKNGIRFSLKTVLMTVNRHTLAEMEAMASEYGVLYRYDTMVFQGFGIHDFGTGNYEGDILSYRLDPETISQIESLKYHRFSPWLNNYRRNGDSPLYSDRLYQCGAGVTNFHINEKGFLFPCILSRQISIDLKSDTFQTGWKKIGDRIQERTAGADYPCNRCRIRSLCAGCPAIFELETGSADRIVDSICRTSRLRYEKLKTFLTDMN